MFKLRLKELRNLRGLTQEQLAAELNISSLQIHTYSNNRKFYNESKGIGCCNGNERL
jgi:transcriptional regulator with XRE-family HTH domain